MARDNEQICMLAFNVFSLICVVYACISINDLAENYRKIELDSEKEACSPYLVWKIVFLLHIIFFMICLSFSVGTAQTYLNEEEQNNRRPSDHIYRLKFEKMLESSVDVVRLMCLGFCGPVILTECIVSVVYYSKIVNGCTQSIPDGFTNVLIYVLIVAGCVSVTVTLFCFYSVYIVGKTVKECWPEIRNPRIQDDEDAQSIMSVDDAERNQRLMERDRRPSSSRASQRSHRQSLTREQHERLIAEVQNMFQNSIENRLRLINQQQQIYSINDSDNREEHILDQEEQNDHEGEQDAQDDNDDYMEYYGEEYYDDEDIDGDDESQDQTDATNHNNSSIRNNHQTSLN